MGGGRRAEGGWVVVMGTGYGDGYVGLAGLWAVESATSARASEQRQRGPESEPEPERNETRRDDKTGENGQRYLRHRASSAGDGHPASTTHHPPSAVRHGSMPMPMPNACLSRSLDHRLGRKRRSDTQRPSPRLPWRPLANANAHPPDKHKHKAPPTTHTPLQLALASSTGSCFKLDQPRRCRPPARPSPGC